MSTISDAPEGTELDASTLKALLSQLAKLLSIAETGNGRLLSTILSKWPGAERRGAFLQMPLSALGLGDGGSIYVRIAGACIDTAEEEEDEAAEDGDYAPEAKKRKLSCAQEARSLFQHADVKQMLRAALGNKVAAVNAAACKAVEDAERAEAQARLEKAHGIAHEKKRALEVERAQKQVERVGREPKPMPPPGAGPGEANEKLGQVLSQLGGSLWHLAKRTIESRENGEGALEAMVDATKGRPAALLETDAFKAAFKAATGEEMPVLQLTPCTGCRTLGCTQCRAGYIR
jgi:hypothetical protein